MEIIQVFSEDKFCVWAEGEDFDGKTEPVSGKIDPVNKK